MTKVRAGHRMIRLCMFMKLIFLHSELEILLKKKGQRQVYQLQFSTW